MDFNKIFEDLDVRVEKRNAIKTQIEKNDFFKQKELLDKLEKESLQLHDEYVKYQQLSDEYSNEFDKKSDMGLFDNRLLELTNSCYSQSEKIKTELTEKQQQINQLKQSVLYSSKNLHELINKYNFSINSIREIIIDSKNYINSLKSDISMLIDEQAELLLKEIYDVSSPNDVSDEDYNIYYATCYKLATDNVKNNQPSLKQYEEMKPYWNKLKKYYEDNKQASIDGNNYLKMIKVNTNINQLKPLR